MSDVKDALAKAKETATTSLVEKREEKLAWVEDLKSLDWRNVPPPVMAQVLTKKPFRGRDTDYYLTSAQAIYFAMACYEMGVSPLSGEAYFDPKNWVVNLTLAGLRRVARNANLNLGAPEFTRLERDWKGRSAPSNMPKDVGYKCRVKVGDGYSEYTAWASEWMMNTPVWQSKTENMLQVRSQEKAIRFALGTGASEMPDERELEDAPEKPNV